jgi:hypothetical protein
MVELEAQLQHFVSENEKAATSPNYKAEVVVTAKGRQAGRQAGKKEGDGMIACEGTTELRKAKELRKEGEGKKDRRRMIACNAPQCQCSPQGINEGEGIKAGRKVKERRTEEG